MTRPPAKTSPVSIAVLGKLTTEQRRYLEACAETLGGHASFLNSFEALQARLSRDPEGAAVVVPALKKNLTAVTALLAGLRMAGSALRLVLVVDESDAPYLPLLREIGVRHVVQASLNGTQLYNALRAAIEEKTPPSPLILPPLTDEETGVNIEQLADELNQRIRCGAGKSQVFLHSWVVGVDRKTTPRITLRCPLRDGLRLQAYVYYEHIRDVCCANVEACAVLRAYAASKGQWTGDYLAAGTSQEQTMSDHPEAPGGKAPTSEATPSEPSRSIVHARPRHGLPEKDLFLNAVVRLGASHLHLKTGAKPRVRVDGKLRTLHVDVLPNADFEEKVFEFLSPAQQRQLMEDGSVDLAYDVPGSDRFRINVFRQESGLSLTARRVSRTIPSFAALNLPPIIQKTAEFRQGLVLMAGSTGSGKSTTIAAMIEHINQTRSAHIVTVEDPIEYLFTPRKSLINQREIGINVKDFPTALRALVSEDPDVVLIGEMRDGATFRAALQAAEAGRLVFGTIPAPNCARAIGHVLNLLPQDERHAARQSLALNLRAAVAQKLLPSTKEGLSQVPAQEVLINVPVVQKMIAEERDAELMDAIRTGEAGMRSFTDSLQWLIENNFIDVETACAAAPDPEELKMRLQGIRPATDRMLGGLT